MKISAVNYAKSLGDVFSEEKDEVAKDFLSSTEKALLVLKDKEIRRFLLSPTADVDKKKKLLQSSFDSEVLVNFLLTLVQNSNLDMLENILRKLEKIVFARSGEVLLKCEGAREISAKQEKLIKDFFKNFFKKDIVLSFQENPRLLGGIRARAEGQLMDINFSNDLSRIRGKIFN